MALCEYCECKPKTHPLQFRPIFELRNSGERLRAVIMGCGDAKLVHYLIGDIKNTYYIYLDSFLYYNIQYYVK